MLAVSSEMKEMTELAGLRMNHDLSVPPDVRQLITAQSS